MSKPTSTTINSAGKKSQVPVKLDPLSLVIPAYNDETTVGRLIDDATELLSKVCDDFEIVVVNDGSRDGTWDVLKSAAAKNAHVRLINHEVNRGYGYTIRELYMSGRKELVFSLPGDYQFAPKVLLDMAQGLNGHDFVIGLRLHRNDPPRRKLQSHIYNAMLRIFYGNRHRDVNSIKLFRRSILNRIQLRSATPFVDAEFCIRADRAGCGVIEIPVEHLPRLSQGASGGKFSVIWETFSDLFKMRSTF